MERLQKIIANAGYCSRRKAEELILTGKVKVNGQIVKTLGEKYFSNSKIEINGRLLVNQNNEKVYIMLNKPRNTISSVSDPQHRKTVMNYLTNIKNRVYPIGRLDYDTAGLLLLTNDGEFANIIMHPKHAITKTYHVLVKGNFPKEKLLNLRNGVVIDQNILVKPASVIVLRYDQLNNQSVIELKIWEGKNHQVKKMFEAINSEILKLKRVAIDFLELDNELKTGQWRFLKPKEIKKLYSLKK